VTIRDFSEQLEKLHIEMPRGDTIAAFSFADKSMKGYIDFDDFK